MKENFRLDKKQVIVIILFLVCEFIYKMIGIVGEYVLIGTFVHYLGFLAVAIYIGYYAGQLFESDLKKKKRLSFFLGLISGIMVAVCLSGEIDVIKDWYAGTRTLTLQQCHVESGGSMKGIHTFHYYLVGKDVDRNTHRLELTFQARNDLANATNVLVEYYENTDRIVDYQYIYKTDLERLIEWSEDYHE